MARRIWCRYCGHPALAIAGVFPAKCENILCERSGFWATDPDCPLIERNPEVKPPTVGYALTYNDRRFLQSIKVSSE